MPKQCKHPTCGDTCRRPVKKKVGYRKPSVTREIGDVKKLELPELLKIAQGLFNMYVRLRDQDKGCISCVGGKPEQCGHYFPVGKFSRVRFHDMNANGQCKNCNEVLAGN
ncbi:MAG: hypothetical protein JWP27_1461, partial [Flaviaesturariibacter sp.]|nr:hypothetical protein [Flaviaesturariibacter sp.]